jgi:hypothetical protein
MRARTGATCSPTRPVGVPKRPRLHASPRRRSACAASSRSRSLGDEAAHTRSVVSSCASPLRTERATSRNGRPRGSAGLTPSPRAVVGAARRAHGRSHEGAASAASRNRAHKPRALGALVLALVVVGHSSETSCVSGFGEGGPRRPTTESSISRPITRAAGCLSEAKDDLRG